MNSARMINECFRRQHPEAFGGLEVSEPHVPIHLRYGHDRMPAPSSSCLTEETVGYPDARPLAE
jgi:hypothetical protein